MFERLRQWRVAAVLAAAIYRVVPVLTSLAFAAVLEPGDYASVALLLVVTPLSSLISSLGGDQALFRQLAPSAGTQLRKDALLQTIAVALALTPIVAAVSFVAAAVLDEGDPAAFATAAAAGGLQAAGLLVASSVLRARRSPGPYLLMMSVASVSGAATRAVLLATGLPAGWSWVFGDVIISLVGFVALVWLGKKASFVPERSDRRKLFFYGFPLSFHGLWQWVLGSSDRFVFAASLPSAAVGLYGAVYQLAGAFNAAASEVNKAGLHHYARPVSEEVRTVQRRDRAVLAGLYVGALIPVLSGLWVLERVGYGGAIPLGIALYGSISPLIIYLPLANAVSVHQGKSQRLSLSSFLGSVGNLVSVIALVPSMGLYAGAVGNGVGFLLMAVTLLPGKRSGRP